jgi:hypothetical protein
MCTESGRCGVHVSECACAASFDDFDVLARKKELGILGGRGLKLEALYDIVVVFEIYISVGSSRQPKLAFYGMMVCKERKLL